MTKTLHTTYLIVILNNNCLEIKKNNKKLSNTCNAVLPWSSLILTDAPYFNKISVILNEPLKQDSCKAVLP